MNVTVYFSVVWFKYSLASFSFNHLWPGVADLATGPPRMDPTDQLSVTQLGNKSGWAQMCVCSVQFLSL